MKLSFQKYPRIPPVEPTKMSILLLHGMGGNGLIWRPVAALLEDNYTVLCPDQRGHGASTVSDDETHFTPEDFTRDLDETLASLIPENPELAAPLWVVGHSMGARTAAAFAATYPARVAGLVIVDLGLTGKTGGGVGDILALFLDKLPDAFASRVEARAFLAENCPDPAIAQYLLAVSHTAADGRITFPFQKRALLQTITQSFGIENAIYVRRFSEATRRPVLVMHGGKSLVYEGEAFARDQLALADLSNVHFQDFPTAGHGLPFEQRAAFIQALKTTLSKSTS